MRAAGPASSADARRRRSGSRSRSTAPAPPRSTTGVPFLDHMLEACAKHGFFDLTVRRAGDLEVDHHHTVEDVGLVLGQALREALGDKRRHPPLRRVACRSTRRWCTSSSTSPGGRSSSTT